MVWCGEDECSGLDLDSGNIAEYHNGCDRNGCNYSNDGVDNDGCDDSNIMQLAKKDE